MIIKRVAEALKRQDWTMVALEFILVVVGVLLAFQINNWGNERAAERESLGAAERLLEEAKQDVAYLRSAVDEQRQRSENMNFALEQLEAGLIREADRDRFAMGLFGLEGTIPIAPPSSVYQDIVSSGTLSQIGDATLRGKVAQYHASLAFEERVQAQIQASIPLVIKFPAITLRYHSDGNLGQTALSFDFDKVRADAGLTKELVRTAQTHRFLLSMREKALKDAIAMCIALGKAVEKPCDVNRVVSR